MKHSLFDRITFDQETLGERACIRGMRRVTVSAVMRLVTEGRSLAEILSRYPMLERADIEQALAYVAWAADRERLSA